MKASLSEKEFRELLLSHHPNLKGFEEDVVIINNRRVCEGCLLAYPTALITATFLFFLGITGATTIYAAIVIAAASQARRLIKNTWFRRFCKVLAGVALGFGITGLFWAAAAKQYFLIGLMFFGACAYAAVRYYNIKKKLEETGTC